MSRRTGGRALGELQIQMLHRLHEASKEHDHIPTTALYENGKQRAVVDRLRSLVQRGYVQTCRDPVGWKLTTDGELVLKRIRSGNPI